MIFVLQRPDSRCRVHATRHVEWGSEGHAYACTATPSCRPLSPPGSWIGCSAYHDDAPKVTCRRCARWVRRQAETLLSVLPEEGRARG